MAFHKALTNFGLIPLFHHFVVGVQNNLMVTGQKFVFLFDSGAGLHSHLIQVDLLLNVFLLLHTLLDHLIELVNLRP